MPDVSVPNSEKPAAVPPGRAKSDAPAARPTQTAALAAGPPRVDAGIPRAAKTETSNSGNAETDSPASILPKMSPLTIVLGGLTVILFIAAVVLWNKVGARDETIVQNQNRFDQAQTASSGLQDQLTKAQAAVATLQKQSDEGSAGMAALQTQLDALKLKSAAFQTQMEEAKVDRKSTRLNSSHIT